MFWFFLPFLLAVRPTTVRSAASYQNVSIVRTCGTESSTSFVKSAESHFSKNKSASEERVTCKGTINVYWHVIRAGDALSEGDIPDSQIKASIKATNSHYSKSGLSLKLVSVDHTTNATWFNYVAPKLPTNTAMKNLLHKGGAADLNVYTVGFKGGPGKGLLGYATFPSSYKGNPKDDGVVIQYSTVPGGSNINYHEGKTLTHEMGHWVGLYHTFQGDSCEGEGDFVNDTPQERTPTAGCEIGKDTCLGGEPDPIHNFMDYSYDSCMREFTAGQIKRFKEQIRRYRGIQV
ncbi:metalloprotease [Ceratobasidium sp. AG-I]|nr:metalloprotease [Ceratobasidium sp. AG-I]